MIVSRTHHGYGRGNINPSDKKDLLNLIYQQRNCNKEMEFDVCGREAMSTFTASKSSFLSTVLLGKFFVFLKISPDSFSLQKIFCYMNFKKIFSSLFFIILL